MKVLSTGLTVAALLAVGACSTNTARSPNDVGSMQLPSTNPGGVSTTTPTGRDVGSSQAPQGSGGVISRTTPGAGDTGSMALPSAAQGNSSTRRY